MWHVINRIRNAIRNQTGSCAGVRLSPVHHLLDAGRGPIRAGVYLMDYLNPAMYCGAGCNPDFLQVARELVAKDDYLAGKAPELVQLDHFEFSKVNGRFDCVLAFSVLNHCDAPTLAP